MDRTDVLIVILVSVYMSLCAANPGDCDIYKDCVECKAFSTGAFGVMDCLHHCNIASYMPVDDKKFKEKLKHLPLCRYKNEESCVFSYRLGEEGDFGPELFIKQDVECPKYEATYPSVVIDVTLEPTTSTTALPAVKNGDKENNNKADIQSDSGVIEDTQSVAGSEKDSSKGKNNLNKASCTLISWVTLTVSLLVIVYS